MNSQSEVDNFLVVLKNGFNLDNRSQQFKSWNQFAEKNKFLVAETIANLDPCENEVF